MKALTLVLVVALAGCASQTGIMWGYAVDSAKVPEVRGWMYTSDRGYCDQALRQNRSPLYAVEFSSACQRLAVVDFDGPVDDANRIYWAMGLRDGAWAVNAPEWCERLRRAFWFSTACQAVVVTPIMFTP